MPQPFPCLWFDGQAEQAAAHYTAIFPNSQILATTRYGPAGPGREGSVMTVSFILDGQQFLGLNGGPEFTFNEAVSFQILCTDQQEVDHYWYGLSEGGQESVCGWLKDRFGVSWQVVPKILPESLSGPDRARAQRVTEAMLGMKKLDVADLQRAAAG